jgi:hypothetical protein
MRRLGAIVFALFVAACSGKKEEKGSPPPPNTNVSDASALSGLAQAVPDVPTAAADAAAAAAPGAVTDDALPDHGVGHDGRGLYYARALTDGDLEGRNLRDLALMRNTIYARAGHSFRKAWLREHFTALPWYRPLPQDDNSKVTATDRANAKLIAARESDYPRDAMLAEQAKLSASSKTNPIDDVELRLLAEQLGQSVGADAVPAADSTLSPLEDPRKLDRLLTLDDLSDLSRRDLRILRNTVYARHGREFKSVVLQEWFENKGWYTRNPDFEESMLTSTDKKNVRLIRSVEDSLGGPMSDHEQQVEDGWWDAA